MYWAGYRFDFWSVSRVSIVVLALLAVAEPYRVWRPNPALFIMTREIAWMLSFAAAAAVLSNLALTLDFPMIDQPLITADHLLGLHWRAYYWFFTDRPVLGLIASILYVLAFPMVACAIIFLSLRNRVDRAQELVLAMMIGALIAIAISAVLPAAGALAWYQPNQSTLIHHPMVDLDYKQTFFDLRSGKVSEFSLAGIKGLIAFPSYHATMSVIVVLAFRGIRAAFWPIAIFGLAVLATTPVEGGHHFVDTLAGVAVAALAVGLAAAWRRRLAAARRHVVERQWDLAPVPD
jgi:membrane-associated phospholipid phosphatase